MKNLAIAAALLSAVLFTLEASAEPPGKGGDGKRGAGQGQKGGFGGGAGQARGKRPGGGQGRPGGGAGRPGGDPAQMVARMMEQFDKDGDQKLNVTELTALLTEMRNRRGGGMQRGGRPGGPGAGQGRPGGGQGRPGAGQGGRPGGGKGRRGGGAEGQDDVGGAKPKRPAVE